jgi:hypothetical protein
MAKTKRTHTQRKQKEANNKQTSQGMENVEISADSRREAQARNDKRVASRDGWQTLFLETFRNSGNVRAACMYADVDRGVVRRALENDDKFIVEYDKAENEAVDLLVAEAWNRARNGSDRLLEFLLKSHRKEVYAERPGATNVAVKIDIDGQKPTDALLGKLSMMSGRLPEADE